MSAVTRTTSRSRGKNVAPAGNFGDKKNPKKLASKKPKKPSRKKLIKDLDGICSQICRIVWGGKCAVCGKAGTSAHHYFGKKACSYLRFVIDNLVWLCFYCHLARGHKQGLIEPIRRAMVKRIGFKRFDELYSMAFKPDLRKVDDLIELKVELSNLLEKTKRSYVVNG